MRPTERRKKVVEGHLVGDVDGRKPQSQFLAIRAEQIIRPDTEIKEVARSDSRRIGVVVLSAISRNAYPQRPSIRRTAHKNGLRRRGKGTAAEQTDLRLLIGSETKRSREIRNAPGNQAAVITPGEVRPPAILVPLIAKVDVLLIDLIVVLTVRPHGQV